MEGEGMKSQRRRASRYLLVVPAFLKNLESGQQGPQDSSGAEAVSMQVVPGSAKREGEGERVKVQIMHNGQAFEAEGRVMNLRSLLGGGNVLTDLDQRQRVALEKWVASLRSQALKNIMPEGQPGEAAPVQREIGGLNVSPIRN
jgi:hypothetical protein